MTTPEEPMVTFDRPNRADGKATERLVLNAKARAALGTKSRVVISVVDGRLSIAPTSQAGPSTRKVSIGAGCAYVACGGFAGMAGIGSDVSRRSWGAEVVGSALLVALREGSTPVPSSIQGGAEELAEGETMASGTLEIDAPAGDAGVSVDYGTAGNAPGVPAKTRVEVWAHDKIVPGDNPRVAGLLDHEKLQGLADTIGSDGMHYPPLCRLHPSMAGYLEIVDGGRRWVVTGPDYLNWPEITVIIATMTDEQASLARLVSNEQREDFDVLERAAGYAKHMRSFSITQTRMGQLVGKDQTYVSNLVCLWDRPVEIQEFVRQNKLVLSAAVSLAGLDDPQDQIEIANHAVRENLSVADIRVAIRARKQKRENEQATLPGSFAPVATERGGPSVGASVTRSLEDFQAAGSTPTPSSKQGGEHPQPTEGAMHAAAWQELEAAWRIAVGDVLSVDGLVGVARVRRMSNAFDGGQWVWQFGVVKATADVAFDLSLAERPQSHHQTLIGCRCRSGIWLDVLGREVRIVARSGDAFDPAAMSEEEEEQLIADMEAGWEGEAEALPPSPSSMEGGGEDSDVAVETMEQRVYREGQERADAWVKEPLPARVSSLPEGVQRRSPEPVEREHLGGGFVNVGVREADLNEAKAMGLPNFAAVLSEVKRLVSTIVATGPRSEPSRPIALHPEAVTAAEDVVGWFADRSIDPDLSDDLIGAYYPDREKLTPEMVASVAVFRLRDSMRKLLQNSPTGLQPSYDDRSDVVEGGSA